MNLMIMLSGVILVHSQPDKTQLEASSGVKIVEKVNILPVVAKKPTGAKNGIKKATSVKKKKKATKKVVKKKVVKKKTKKKTVKRYNISYNKSEVYNYAYSLVKSYGWSDYDWECLVKLWNRESGWNLNAVNKRSGACGIPQSLPCSKMKSEGTDYRTNYKTQIRWGLKYILARYGSPANAWGHSQQKGWY